ncbi:MAG TPA: hypothetical protein VD838_16655, partial [Anaeromyxobacteraceae bacterium]|nr:hypothetical protein [Anaeromyxobacteraceae bacterium]
KEGVLFFRPEFTKVGAGLWQELRIPDHETLGDGPKSLSRKESFDYDFAGTTLEVVGEPGLAVLGSALDEDGWAVRVRCDVPDRPAELRVRVRAEGGEVRYEDAFDLSCRAPTRMEISKPEVPQRCAVGARVLVAHSIFDASGVRLSGHGVAVQDPESAALAIDPGQPDTAGSQLWLAAVRPGAAATLRAGAIGAAIPVEVVTADVLGETACRDR